VQRPEQGLGTSGQAGPCGWGAGDSVQSGWEKEELLWN
jgi:hypothetical protein